MSAGGVSGTGATPDPTTSTPLSKDELKTLAQSTLSKQKGADSLRVQSDVKEKNGFYTFKVGDGYRTYTVRVEKAYIDGLSTPDQQDWAKGLSLQLVALYSSGSSQASFNLEARSITINHQTFFFATQDQVQQHKNDYEKLLTDLDKTKQDLEAAEKEIKDIQSSAKTPSAKTAAELEKINDELTAAKGERFAIQLQLKALEAEVKVMHQVHLISGQLFVEGGLEQTAPPAAGGAPTSITRSDLPKLPEMGSVAGIGGIVATVSGASGTSDVPPVPPSTYKTFEELSPDIGKPHRVGKPILNDGWTPRMVAFAEGIQGHDLVSIQTLEKLKKDGVPLTREEQWVLLGQVRKELRNMESQLNTIVGKWNLEESLLPPTSAF